MDHRQSAIQGSGANASAPAQEWLYPASDWQPEQVVVDGAVLMELLEDASAADQLPEDVDRLTHVIQSLEAEIGGGDSPPSAVVGGGNTAELVPGDVDAGGLEDYLLPDLGSIPGPCVAEAPFEYWAAEMPAAVGHDMGGWYVDSDGVMVEYELREQCYYSYSESPHLELVYSPLWE